MQADFTVIVVNWNGAGLLRECLASVLSVSGRSPIKTIVVDNGSKDNSVSMIRNEFPEVEVIEAGRNLGFGAANNLALRRSSGEFVLFLNPDARLTTGFFETVLSVFSKNERIGAVGCRMLNERNETEPLMPQSYPTPFSEFVRMFRMADRLLKRFGMGQVVKDPETSGSVLKISGGCMAVRRDILQALGGFDERFFMYCEDGELCRRMTSAGWILHYSADAAVVHVQGSCSRKAPPGFSTLMQHESFYKYMEKYYGRLGAYRYRVFICIGSLIRLMTCCVLVGIATLFARERADKWRLRLIKNRRICCWALGLARAPIPE